ncbi:DNA mismatch repair protein MutS [Methanolacinia petrolearia]|uniref:DNA mismatch repair protein MutS n=1 Tax=Methanolacinia petrolearia TaxID=54120 RepID=UPI003BABFF9F
MTDGPTPAMRQFYEMKSKHPGTVLFFQMGDFYETFGEDAEVVSRELDITLTSRGRDKNGEKMSLAGVPIHAGESYISRLVKKGYRVAVCDQIEDPKKAKGIVKRDVVRIITPGTIIDSGMIENSGPSYLMSVMPGRDGEDLGFAFLDISTGEFFISASGNGEMFSQINSEIARYRPSECIVPENCPKKISDYITGRNVLVTGYDTLHFDIDTARNYLLEKFEVNSLEGYGCMGMDLSVCAAGACLSYACETQKSDLSHIRGFLTRLPSGSMVLDAITLRNLEVLENIRTRQGKNSLYDILDETKTPMGSRVLRSWLTAPLVDRENINSRLDAVEFFFNNLYIRESLRSLLHRYADIERIAARISYGNAGPRELVTLKNSLAKIPEIRSLFSEEGAVTPELISCSLGSIESLDECVELIERSIEDEPPVLARTGGLIKRGYNHDLDELRDSSGSAKEWIAQFQQDERDRTGIKSLKVSYNKVFGYYIEVTKSNLKLVPPEYQRKQTTANGERFTLPELQEKESLIVNAEERFIALEQDLYTGILTELREKVEEILETAKMIGRLDVLADFAHLSSNYNYVRPVIEDSTRLLISDGRHPVVERNQSSGFVPNDAGIDSSDNQILIITGANMAGKSTYMREVALLCIMAQAGCFVPASGAVIGIIDRIFTRVGAFDDLSSGQSTFMVEMLELANILNNVTDKSLVILDEIGRGTSTLDGYSIACAVIEYLHGSGSSGPRTLFATHFHEMVDIEGKMKRVKNYHFAVKDTGSDIVFLRKLIPGASDKSYGIHVAKLAGIPRKVLKRSEEILREEQEKEYSAGGRIQPRYTQMLLVDQPTAVEPALDENTKSLLKRVKDLDPDSLTPREALAVIYQLREEAGGNKK